ncbi:MFS transporter [Microbulbifer sp. 2201CG32-9]|uniref:MFS transporter n=1 Tax=Microbulbifer sp. 2201CG32-9 TaxID=3232309 RepID=UPI00345B8BE7
MRKSLQRRKIHGVVASQGAVQMVLLTQIPLIAEHCGLELASIGGLVALGTFCLMIAGPAWGSLGDRIGRKSVVLAGLVGALLAQCLFVVLLLGMALGHWDGSQAMPALMASRVMYGLHAAAIYPGCQAWAVKSGDPARRLATLSGLSAAANLGRGLGPLLVLPALLLGDLWPLAWLIVLPLAALLLTMSLPSARAADKPAKTSLKAPLPPAALALFATALLGTVSVGQLQVVMGPVLQDLYGLSALGASSTAAVLLAAVAICGFVVQVGLVRRLEAPQLSLILGVVSLGVGTLLLYTTLGGGAAAVGLLLFVVGTAFLVPGYSALLSQSGLRGGRLFGTLSMMHTGGYSIGFAAGGWLYQQQPQESLLGLLVSVGLIAVCTGFALMPGWGSGRRRPADNRQAGQ